jgi:hypothetical protein
MLSSSTGDDLLDAVDCVGFEAKITSGLSVSGLSASSSSSLENGNKKSKINLEKNNFDKSNNTGKKIDNKIFENLHIMAYVQINGMSCASCVRSLETGDYYLFLSFYILFFTFAFLAILFSILL